MKHLVVFALLFGALAISAMPTLAATKLIVAPTWHPGTQLTSLDTNGAPFPTYNNGDDYRYVDVDVLATTNVQFWTVQFTCTVSPTLLDGGYVHDKTASTPDPGDDIAPVIIGPDWSWHGDSTSIIGPYNASTGAVTVTISLLGSDPPMGANGYDTTVLLAKLRYRVRQQAGNFTSGTSTFTCTSSFLNRNGVSVGTPTYTAPAPLNIINGYSINGVVQYQGRTAQAGIGVQCDLNDTFSLSDSKQTTTAANGSFSIPGLRKLGWYKCYYYGNGSTASSPAWAPDADTYLTSFQWVNLFGASAQLLPVTLYNGDVERATTGGYITTAEDLALVTSNFGLPASPQPYLNGDANGDKLTDKADLAIVSANTYRNGPLNGDHWLLSVATDGYINNRLHLTNDPIDQVYAVGSTQLVSGTNRDYWPALSPDGKWLAFSRAVGTGNTLHYVLHMAPVNNGTVGTPIRLTPTSGWIYDDLAPSWSPDGSRIAFNCSATGTGIDNNGKSYIWRSWTTNNSNICVVDISGNAGRNVRSISYTNSIYPPAWLTADKLVFNCGSTICGYDLTNTAYTYDYSPNIEVGNGEIADMPSITPYGPNGHSALMYRFFDGTTRQLRIAEIIDPSNGSIPAYYNGPTNTAPSPYHLSVQYFDGTNYNPLTNNLDYYAMDWDSRNVVFSEYYPDPYSNFTYSGSGCSFSYAFPVGLNIEWSYAQGRNTYNINMWCNPWWSGNTNDTTDLFGLRNTVTWVP